VSRILIVEPHPDVRALLEVAVTRLGHEAIAPGSGPTELAAADTLEIDAAVVEPGQGAGRKVAHRLRERGIPTIFVSIFPADDTTAELEPAGYLVKPFALYAFERAVAKVLAPAPQIALARTALAR
jgi:DNA-binding response OmpR family regulator